MSRDIRVSDNWALLHAVDEAQRTNSPLATVFTLVDDFLDRGARQACFMLRGLQLVERKLKEKNIPFFLLRGNPGQTLPEFALRCKARLITMDYSPLREARKWKHAVMDNTGCALEEVDAHNVVPVWLTSSVREKAAFTIRPKIHSRLGQFLTNFPPMKPLPTNAWPASCTADPIDWDALQEEARHRGAEVPEVSWLVPGEDAGKDALAAFLQRRRLSLYAPKRNDPTVPEALSGLSPYLHFGFLSPQRAAFEAQKQRQHLKESVDKFLDELIIWRELSENLCHYEPRYDSLEAAAPWARQTLQEHLADKREYMYTREEFEKARTHDNLWNACQKELLYAGKLHGYMRMYWAKKILEWSATAEEALDTSIYMNDKYSLDGTDPNGYAGCQWSITGIHDREFHERPVTGKIRPMTFRGCKNKFNVDAYIARVDRLEKESQKPLI